MGYLAPTLLGEEIIMKFKKFLVLVFAVSFLFPAANSFGGKENPLQVPSAYAPAEVYQFGSVLEGTGITHDFIIQNRGTAPLKIERVKSG